MRVSISILFAGSLAACAPSFPPIAAHGGDSAFKARMADAYRPGSRAARLRDDLAAEGFAISAADSSGRLWRAVDRPGNLPCYSRTEVDWREDGRGRIVELTAERNDCT